MKLTFTNLSGDVFGLDLAEDMEVENVKALCEMEVGIPAATMILSANGRDIVNDKDSLKACGLRDGDMVLVRTKSAAAANNSRPAGAATPNKVPKIDFASIPVPGVTSPTSGSSSAGPSTSGFSPVEIDRARKIAQGIKQNMLHDPSGVQEQMAKFPGLLDAALRDDYVGVAGMIRKEEAEARRKAQLLYTDPDSHEAQQMIEEQIKRQRIQENFEYALEHAPESLTTVHMLYVSCSVNGFKMKAFVDSGAQVSIISRDFAQRCHIDHLIDERYQGMAVGVGSQRFVGKIHACQMEIGGAFMTTSFAVLDANNMQILLGLDMLKRHQMIIDLKRNVLVVGTTNAETPFLHESEIPDNTVGQLNGPSFVPNETDIQQLVGMGFTRDESKEALMKHEGNKEVAVADLLSKKASGAGAPKTISK